MLRVHSSRASLSSANAVSVVGSFNDDRSYAMYANANANGASSLRPSDLPDPLGPLSSSSSATSSPGPSTPSSSSEPRLIAVRRAQCADAAGGKSEADESSANFNGAVEPLAEEMQHASDLSGNNSFTESRMTTSESDASLARVDLREIGEDSHNFTTNTLRKCKLQVLKPYWALLIFIGWRVFRHDVITPRSCKLRVLNALYPVFIVLLLLYTYLYEMVACQWKLNIVKDTEIRTLPRTTTPAFDNHTANATTTLSPSVFMFEDTDDMGNGSDMTATVTSSPPPAPHPEPCEHIVTTYLIPNVLHFVAYVTGLYYFRVQDSEQMYALMEKVFLQANPLHTSSSSQQKLVFKTRLFLVFGATWVLMALALQALYVCAYDFPALAIFEEYGVAFQLLTFSTELLGRIVFNSVLLAVTINYATQCEMVMFYVKGLSLRLQEKSAGIKTAFKDVWLLRQSLSLLNGVISKMTSWVLLILAELTIIGISILAKNAYNIPKVWLYRSLFPIVWGIMLCFPLFQAARVNTVCLRIRKISLEMRVFGYKNSSQLELDSFLQFVHNTRLRAKLFHVPVHPSYLMALFILTAFVFLLLVQTTHLLPPSDFI